MSLEENKFELILKGEAISLNNIERSGFYKSGSKVIPTRYKTDRYKTWHKDMFAQVNKLSKELFIFATKFDAATQAIKLEYEFHIDNLYVKSGVNKNRISKISGDIDNKIKPVQDIVFNYLSKINYEIDDAQIVETKVAKLESTDNYIKIKIIAVDLILPAKLPKKKITKKKTKKV